MTQFQKRETTLNKIKTGDKVRIKKPKDVKEWPEWVKEMDHTDGAVVTVPTIQDAAEIEAWLKYKGWKYNLDWCEKVEEEMTLAQWERMSPQERLERNRPAFEALTAETEGVEWLDADGRWWPSDSVDLIVPHRAVKRSTAPPKEVWFVVDKQGTIATVSFENQEAAEEAADGYVDDFGARVVKYVIAE